MTNISLINLYVINLLSKLYNTNDS